MARSFDGDKGRINLPKVPQGPPGAANIGAGTGMKQPSTIRPVQPRTRKDEIQQPMAQPGAKPTAAPSHTQPVGPPGAPPAQAAGGWAPSGVVKTGEQFQGPGGEKISVKPGPEQQAAQAAGGGTQPLNEAGGPVAPPMQPSPLGADSPIESHATQGGFRVGQNAHIRALAMVNTMEGMSREQQIDHERKAVRDFQMFGAYEGMDDPNSPPPPIAVGGYSFNPETSHWVEPEGVVSVNERD